LRSGLGDFGQSFHEKALSESVLQLTSMSPDTAVKVEIYGASNPNAPASDAQKKGERLLASRTLTVGKNIFSMHFYSYYFSDRLLVTVNGVNCELSARSFNVGLVRSGSKTRA